MCEHIFRGKKGCIPRKTTFGERGSVGHRRESIVRTRGERVEEHLKVKAGNRRSLGPVGQGNA